MDRLEHYCTLIKNLLREDANIKPAHGDIEPLLVFDDEHLSYQLMYIGWSPIGRTHGPLIHVRIHNEKIWVEYDGTEESIALRLVEHGVPKEDIVLGFHREEKRKFTEFAVN